MGRDAQGTKCHFRLCKMSYLDRCKGSEMSRGRNVRVAKDVMGRMLRGRNVTKCQVAKMSWGEMSGDESSQGFEISGLLRSQGAKCSWGEMSLPDVKKDVMGRRCQPVEIYGQKVTSGCEIDKNYFP